MYIDPNTGGMLFQVLAVLFALASGTVLIFSGKMRMLWARLMRSRSQNHNQDDTHKTG